MDLFISETLPGPTFTPHVLSFRRARFFVTEHGRMSRVPAHVHIGKEVLLVRDCE